MNDLYAKRVARVNSLFAASLLGLFVYAFWLRPELGHAEVKQSVFLIFKFLLTPALVYSTVLCVAGLFESRFLKIDESGVTMYLGFGEVQYDWSDFASIGPAKLKAGPPVFTFMVRPDRVKRPAIGPVPVNYIFVPISQLPMPYPQFAQRLQAFPKTHVFFKKAG